MRGLPPGTERERQDHEAISKVKSELIRRFPKGVSSRDFFGGLVRRAIDEVLTMQTMRYRIDQLAPPEQTYIGTRVEILVREALDVGFGTRSDTLIAGEETDIKWSRHLNWMIGPENLDTVCLGIGTESSNGRLSVGLFIPHRDELKSQNRDKKFSASSGYRTKHVSWIIKDAELEANFIATLSEQIRNDIMSGASAQERIKRLAELVPDTLIPRSAIRFVSMNKDDFMRRIRKDRTKAGPTLGGFECLSWKYKKSELTARGFAIQKDHFVFVRRNPEA
jgi:hypothetical protein